MNGTGFPGSRAIRFNRITFRAHCHTNYKAIYLVIHILLENRVPLRQRSARKSL